MVNLSGTWSGRPDPGRVGRRERWFEPERSGPDAAGWEQIRVPSCWNTYPRYERYEGTYWYAVDFELVQDRPDCEIETYLRFMAVNYYCRVWVNGQEVGAHEGGYLPFEIFVPPEHLVGINRLVVEVENFRAPNRIPGELCDWFNYGGIVREVELEFRSPRHFRTVRVVTRPMPSGVAEVDIAYQQKEAFPFTWTIRREGEIVTEGMVEKIAPVGSIEVKLPHARLWSPESPNLYDLELTPAPSARANGKSLRFGVRQIKVDGHRILLNGEPIKMKGVSLHEELMPFGRTISREDRYRDVRDIKALGFNALRTAHYTHDEALVQAADEIGLLVLEEIPVYWYLDYEDPQLYNKAANMVRDMIARDFNHPSVILWSVGNEIPVDEPACDEFIRKLMAVARKFDQTRIVTYVSCRFLMDETRKSSDVACLNCYLGWYFGKRDWLGPVLGMCRETAPDKPWILTEFGAGARAGLRKPGGTYKFSEEFQAEFLSHYIRTANALDWVAGWFIWIYRDFRSPIRTNKHQRGFNRKGIVDEAGQQKMICGLLEQVMDDAYEGDVSAYTDSFRNTFRRLEEIGAKVVQPLMMRRQRAQYGGFYRRKPGKDK